MRFPRFEGEWESFALGQLCEEFQSGKGIKSDQIKDLGSYPVYGGNGLRGYTDSYNHEGVYTLIGRQGAKCGNVRLVSGRTYITEHAVAVKANQANVTEFLNWLFIKMDLGQYSDQSAQPGLAVNKLVRLNAFVPKKEEQKRIADLMTLIDARIAIQNKVIEKYESLIKALAYDTIGKYTPNTLLSECVRCSSSTLKESDLTVEGAVPAYGAAGISGFTDSALSDEDSILITKDGSGVGSLRYVNGPHSFVGTLNSMTSKEEVYLPYIYYALQNVCFESYRTGQAIPHIYFKDYGKEAIYCPSFDEQKRLANGLEMIDSKVGIERATLQYLHSVKAYLLSAMFI